MTNATAKTLMQAAETAEINYAFSDSYSGRGMYGKQTCSLSLAEYNDLFVLVGHACHFRSYADTFENFIHEVSNLRTDNMGGGVVLY